MAMGLLDVFTGDAAKEAAAASKKRLTTTNATNQNLLSDALTSGTGYLQQGISGYQPLYDYGQSALASGTMYQNALGVNGAEGTKAAQDAFTGSAGYQYQTDQALENTLRKANASGMSLSGNALSALNTQASDLASTNYNNWLTNLSNASNQGINALSTAAGGQSQGYSNLASLGTNIAGQQVAGNQWATTGQNNADYTAAQASMQGGANLLNFGMGLGNLYTKTLGK